MAYMIFYKCFITARYMLSSCVCPSVCLSQIGVLSKQLNIRSRKQRHTLVQGL